MTQFVTEGGAIIAFHLSRVVRAQTDGERVVVEVAGGGSTYVYAGWKEQNFSFLVSVGLPVM